MITLLLTAQLLILLYIIAKLAAPRLRAIGAKIKQLIHHLRPLAHSSYMALLVVYAALWAFVLFILLIKLIINA